MRVYRGHSEKSTGTRQPHPGMAGPTPLVLVGHGGTPRRASRKGGSRARMRRDTSPPRCRRPKAIRGTGKEMATTAVSEVRRRRWERPGRSERRSIFNVWSLLIEIEQGRGQEQLWKQG